MTYAKISDVCVGDVLIANDGFGCLDAGQRCVVKRDSDGLYVDCRWGRHWLPSQLDADSYLIGLTKEAK